MGKEVLSGAESKQGGKPLTLEVGINKGLSEMLGSPSEKIQTNVCVSSLSVIRGLGVTCNKNR